MGRLTFQQIEQPAPGQQPVKVVLTGRATPVGILAWETVQRGSKEYVAGNDVASVILNGGMEGPLEFSFEWLGRELAQSPDVQIEGQLVDTAGALIDRIAQMTRERALVLVTWETETRLVENVCFFERFLQNEARLDEFRPQLTVSWVKAPNSQQLKLLNRVDPRTVVQQLTERWDAEIGGVVEDLTFARQNVEDVRIAVDDVRLSLDRMSQVADQINGITRSVAAVQRGVGETMVTVIADTYAVADAVQAAPGTLAQSDRAAQQIRAGLYAAETSRAARNLRHGSVAALSRSALAQGQDRDALGIHVARAGQTVWQVAWLWYRSGQPDAIATISNANALRSRVLRSGQRLVIPRRARG